MPNQTENMTTKEFIEFCHQSILQRTPNEQDLPILAQLLESEQLSREDLIIQFLMSKEYKAKQATGEFVGPGHFYSVIPSLEDRAQYVAQEKVLPDVLPGIKLNIEAQLSLLRSFQSFYDECPFPEEKSEEYRYYFRNPAYAFTDGFTLYFMMRHFKPKNIIEVGSGYSSCIMLDTNDHFLDNKATIQFIEPYPELLYSLINEGDRSNKIFSDKVQDIDAAVFEDLNANDILFIDSTHVSKLNSDVNKLVFEVLPTLKKGVLVHIHDIFWPFEYPQDWIREGRAWNENYLLRAFLEFNDSFEILYFANYMGRYDNKWIKENMPRLLNNSGGNIWLRRIED